MDKNAARDAERTGEEPDGGGEVEEEEGIELMELKDFLVSAFWLFKEIKMHRMNTSKLIFCITVTSKIETRILFLFFCFFYEMFLFSVGLFSSSPSSSSWYLF